MIIRNRSVWPTLFLLNVFTALKGAHLYSFIYGVLPANVLAAMATHTEFGLNTGALSLASVIVTVTTKSFPVVLPSAFVALNKTTKIIIWKAQGVSQ